MRRFLARVCGLLDELDELRESRDDALSELREETGRRLEAEERIGELLLSMMTGDDD